MTRILVIFAFLLITNIIKCQTSLRKLLFTSTEINEWRIYYERGSVIDSLNLNKPIFAVQGEGAELKKLGIDTLLNKMFYALKQSKIEKRTTITSNFGDTNPFNYKGKPEHISIWWKTKGDMNYYRILVTLKESSNIPEEKFNYVIVCAGPSGNNQTLHYVEKEKVMTVVSTMKYIANKNWGENYVKKP